jgi:UDP-N-acetylmuramoylalanine--D-glutamate ligase
MSTAPYVGQQVDILGFGVEGQSSARFFLDRGARVIVHDQEVEFDPDSPYNRMLDRGVVFRLGQQAFTGLESSTLLVRSPGVPLRHPALRSLPPDRMTSQTQLFLQQWQHRSIGVTGTKGKGTTSSLLTHILQTAGVPVLLGGNIGKPLLDLIDQMNEQVWAVLELSSFQLQDVTVSPHGAMVLMIAPEHLNYHATLEEYVSAKARILDFQTADSWAVLQLASSLSDSLQSHVHSRLLTIGYEPQQNGAIIREQSVILVQHAVEQVIIRLDETQLRGTHNLENIAAAAVAARQIGVDPIVMAEAIRSFVPLPHRLELVARHQEISFYNDSFSTTPEAAIAALHSFGEPLVMILGGSEKDSDYRELARELHRSKNLVGLIIIGAVADRMAEAINQAGGTTCPVIRGLTLMPQIVSAAAKLLGPIAGPSVVLMSPGAASFGLFRNYKDRGEQFHQAAQALADHTLKGES